MVDTTFIHNYCLVYTTNGQTFSLKEHNFCFLKEKVKMFKMDEWFLFKDDVLIRSSSDGCLFL